MSVIRYKLYLLVANTPELTTQLERIPIDLLANCHITTDESTIEIESYSVSSSSQPVDMGNDACLHDPTQGEQLERVGGLDGIFLADKVRRSNANASLLGKTV